MSFDVRRGVHEGIESLAARIGRPDARVTILTGAGVSAASGVPTFRGAEGLWRTFRPEDLATPEAFARDPSLVWEWYRWRRQIVSGCSPNRAHDVVARWSQRDGVTSPRMRTAKPGVHEHEVEAEMIRFALTYYRGQMSEMARRLGIGRSTLYRKMKDYGLDEPGGSAPGDAAA